MNSSVQRGIRAVALTSVVTLLAVAGASSASADTDASATSTTDSTAAQVASAVAATGTTPAAPNDAVDISTATGTATVDTVSGGQLTMSTPTRGDGQTSSDGLTTVYDGTSTDTSVALQPTDTGVRAAITIDSAAAPEDYEFQMGGDVASLELNADGSVTALDANNDSIAFAPAPWAVDVDGNAVPTHYEVSGTTLTQVVEHKNGNWAYGITADPFFSTTWHIAKCVATLAANTVVAYKLIKGLKAGLSLYEFATLLVKGTFKAEKLLAVAGAVTGVSSIIDACL